ncbi:acyl-CoA dehydrogenase related protein [Thermoplasma acidophilum]|uniref:Acyl-CoA dehydrogenase related protein n=1 Tax=Thermoplasma acidophilum (strain ATCC 25905 / DSM 1728 / JCM 9062 / NBRC 15155 / AMRC-C165) TaxID=273075 RepID=Q9HKF5_THEAC|nr:acyl-CoA dehydrogenase related protein [Thermoplasma acidophilum]
MNYFSDDIVLQDVLNYLGYDIDDKLQEMGRYVSEEMIEDSIFIDHYGEPVLQMWGILDNRTDGIWISRTHQNMIDRLLDMGVVSKIASENDLMYHFISGYLISDAGLFCTLTLTGQTAYGLRKYGDARLQQFLNHYANSDHWLGATYYTEIQGGSDLGANQTTAVRSGDKYILNGENKYFASNAGLADGAIVTARMEGARPGAKGISVFFVPTLRSDGTRNYEIRRIKDKLGTIMVPTGEVVLKDSEGYLLGDEKNGIYIALEILEVSRIDDAIAAMGIARKALWEAYFYANKRTAFGKPIIDHPLMLRDLAEMESEVEASTVLSMIAADMFNKASHLKPPYDDQYHMARAFTHMAKNIASWSSDYVTRYTMEVFGGKGFLKEFPVEKFHRDSIVTSLWEGTSNIQALDFLEIVQKRGIDEKILALVWNIMDNLSSENAAMLKAAFDSVRERMVSYKNSENMEYFAKDILNMFGYLSALAYMFSVSEKTGNPGMQMAARIYYYRHFANSLATDIKFSDFRRVIDWMNTTGSEKVIEMK